MSSVSGPLTVVVPMPPSYRGGTEEYAYQVARHCAASRPVRILTTSVRWDPGASGLSVGAAEVTRLNAREMLDRPVLRGRAAWRTLREAVEGSSVVQLHMPFPSVERRVTAWAKARGVPSVLTYHMDAQFGERPEALFPRTVASLYKGWSALPALRAASAVVSNSLGYARASPVLSRFLGKVRVIYQGIDLDRLTARDPASASAVPARTPGRARVLFVGRIVPYKGLTYLIDAVGSLVRAGSEVELLIGGKGPQLEELRQQVAARGLGGSVRFLGFVPDAALGPLYESADVVACPSVSLLESTPISLQEAMTFGTPVVGTTLAGTEETIPNDGRRGRLVAPKDVTALAAALQELLAAGRPGGATPGRTWADTAREYLKLFDELERSGGRASP